MGSQTCFGLLGLALLSCASGIPYGAPPPCPPFEAGAVTDYVRVLVAEDRAELPQLDALHEWMEQQLLFCQGLDAYRKSMD